MVGFLFGHVQIKSIKTHILNVLIFIIISILFASEYYSTILMGLFYLTYLLLNDNLSRKEKQIVSIGHKELS